MTQKRTSAAYLQEMGIQKWMLRVSSNVQNSEQLSTATCWEKLAEQVANCKRCDLYKTRTQTVFGTGNKAAELMIVGEAPGANEDLQGEPFVGRAGKLLTSMLKSINYTREQVYITNIVKSRPPNNRDPTPEEVAACIPYLQQQIILIQPKLILVVGRIAAHHLLGINTPIGQMRGQEYSYGENKIPVLVTYHPAYLLRSPREKRKAWHDMEKVKGFLIS